MRMWLTSSNVLSLQFSSPLAIVRYIQSALGTQVVVLAIAIVCVALIISIRVAKIRCAPQTTALLTGSIMMVVGLLAAKAHYDRTIARAINTSFAGLHAFTAPFFSTGQVPDRLEKLVPPLRTSQVRFAGQSPELVVVLFSDSLRADHLPQYGYERDTMPQLGKDFRWHVMPNNYAHCSLSIDSMSITFFSHYLALFGIRGPSLLEYLQKHGVETHFYSQFVEDGGSVSLFGDANPNHVKFVDDHFAKDEKAWKVVTDAATMPLEQRRPRFITFWSKTTHFPYYQERFNKFTVHNSLPKDSDTYLLGLDVEETKNAYDNSILDLDDRITQLVQALRTSGRLARSVIILTADHGESLGENGAFYHSGTLRDQEIRVPLMFRIGEDLKELDRAISEGKNRISGLIDLAPTVVEMLQLPAQDTYQGASILSQTKDYELTVYPGPRNEIAVMKGTAKGLFRWDTGEASYFPDYDEKVDLLKSEILTFDEFWRYVSDHMQLEQQPERWLLSNSSIASQKTH